MEVARYWAVIKSRRCGKGQRSDSRGKQGKGKVSIRPVEGIDACTEEDRRGQGKIYKKKKEKEKIS